MKLNKRIYSLLEQRMASAYLLGREHGQNVYRRAMGACPKRVDDSWRTLVDQLWECLQTQPFRVENEEANARDPGHDSNDE